MCPAAARSRMKDLEYFGHTDIGTKREANEDNYLCVDLSPDIRPKPGPAALLVVADGIGGHAGGAVASELRLSLIAARLVPTTSCSSAARRCLLYTSPSPRDCS